MNDITNNSSNKKNIFYTAMLILTLIITIIGTAYALLELMKSQEEGSSSVYTGTFSVSYLTGRVVNCSLMPIYTPASVDEVGSYTNTFSVSSTGTLNADVDIHLIVNYNEFPDTFLKYALYDGNNVLMTGYMGEINGTNDIMLAENIIIPSNATATYTLQIWMEENNEDQTEYMKKRMTGTIFVDAIQEIN